jgi:hypothetical protein
MHYQHDAPTRSTIRDEDGQCYTNFKRIKAEEARPVAFHNSGKTERM